MKDYMSFKKIISSYKMGNVDIFLFKKYIIGGLYWRGMFFQIFFLCKFKYLIINTFHFKIKYQVFFNYI